MQPLNTWSWQARSRIKGVFTDIDDTLTTDGAITPDALAAVGDLKARGLTVIAITGRPVGWSEPFALHWPVDAIVAENGAVLLQNSHQKVLRSNGNNGDLLLKSYQQSDAIRVTNFARMQQMGQRILQEVPGTLLARDSAGRETDMAIDHSEFTHLPPEKIARVVAIMQAEGMTATVSSIHINEMDRWVFVGDSTNDQLMFEAFPNSVGVANVRRFEAQLVHLPRYITEGARGAGFAELARAVLSAQPA